MWVLVLLAVGTGYPGAVSLSQVSGFDSDTQCRDAGRKARNDLSGQVTFSCVETQRK